MARNLFCRNCDKAMKRAADKCDEFYESIAGKSKREFLCDGCYPENYIHVGDLCYASVLLPSKQHFNYEIQKPQVWMNDYLIPAETAIKKAAE